MPRVVMELELAGGAPAPCTRVRHMAEVISWCRPVRRLEDLARLRPVLLSVGARAEGRPAQGLACDHRRNRRRLVERMGRESAVRRRRLPLAPGRGGGCPSARTCSVTPWPLAARGQDQSRARKGPPRNPWERHRSA